MMLVKEQDKVTVHFNTSYFEYLGTCFFIRINLSYNRLQTNNLQDDSAGSMKIHCNPASITYKNIIYTFKKI